MSRLAHAHTARLAHARNYQQAINYTRPEERYAAPTDRQLQRRLGHLKNSLKKRLLLRRRRRLTFFARLFRLIETSAELLCLPFAQQPLRRCRQPNGSFWCLIWRKPFCASVNLAPRCTSSRSPLSSRGDVLARTKTCSLRPKNEFVSDGND